MCFLFTKYDIMKITTNKKFILTNIAVIVTLLFTAELTIFLYQGIWTHLLLLLESFALLTLTLLFIASLVTVILLGTFVIKAFRSKRFDLLLTLLLGEVILKLYLLDNFTPSLKPSFFTIEQYLEPASLAVLGVFGAVLVGILIIYKDKLFILIQKYTLKKKPANPSRLISDTPWMPGDKDLLEYKSYAENFADTVLKTDQAHPLVFGIEAPWGTGKTSFLNMCQEQWERHEARPVVFRFDPWYFNSDEDLIRNFFTELKIILRKKYLLPEVDSYLSQYAALLSKATVVRDFPHIKASETVHDTHEILKEYLAYLQQPIIIIVDDLDRINRKKALQILQLVALCADFPYVNYVLCYDVDNLHGGVDAQQLIKKRLEGEIGNFIGLKADEILEKKGTGVDRKTLLLKEEQQYDSSHIQLYLEKIINTKYILPYFRKDLIIKYFAEKLYATLTNLSNKPENIKLTENDFYQKIKSFIDDYPFIARKYLFSIRQTNSIINTFLSVSEADRRAFLYDINKFEHLLLLLIIKYHHPSVYADICYYEYGRDPLFFAGYLKVGKLRYHFTPVGFSDDDKNKPGYKKYIEENNTNLHLSTLLTLLFEANDKFFGDKTLTNYGLNQLIKLIEGIEESELTQSVFIEFFNQNKKFTQSTVLLDMFDIYAQEIYKDNKKLSEPKLSIQKEARHDAFRKRLYKNIYEINRIDDTFSPKLLNEVVETLPYYSEYSLVNLVPEIREIAPYLILRLLNDGVWNKKGDGNNTVKNIEVISHYILGDTKTNLPSLLEKFAKGRGALGIYDMLHFRSSCNNSRGGDIWDVTRSLLWHKLTQNGKLSVGDEVINNTNNKNTLEEITLATFEIFKKAYIDIGKNILLEFKNVTDEVVLGKRIASNKKLLKQIQADERHERRIKATKARMEVFTTYDLCLEGEPGGIRSGGYLYKGRKIRDWMQDYMFNVCFNSTTNTNKELFVEYALKGFNTSSVSKSGRETVHSSEFSFNGLALVLGKERVLKYWKDNRKSIKTIFKNKEGEVVAENYIAYYQDQGDDKSESDLSNPTKTGVFDVLDCELEKYKEEQKQAVEDAKKKKVPQTPGGTSK